MAKKILGFFKSKWGIAILVVVIGGGIWFSVARSHKTTYQFVTMKRGTITEVVSVTGNVTTTRSVDLSVSKTAVPSRPSIIMWATM